MRRKVRARSKSKGRTSESTRLTPKSAKDVKVIRISSVAYNAVYFLAEENNMTMTDAVSFMVGLAWKQLYKKPINAPGPTRKSQTEEGYPQKVCKQVRRCNLPLKENGLEGPKRR